MKNYLEFNDKWYQGPVPQGEWEEDNCPFDFAQKKQGEPHKKKFKSVDRDVYAYLKTEISCTIINIYQNDQLIKQLKVRINSEYWNFNSMIFTSQYLYVLSNDQTELYYYNNNQEEYFSFTQGLIESVRYQNNQLNLIVSENSTTLNLYIIDETFQLRLFKKINSKYIQEENLLIKAKHPQGFFVQLDNFVSLISNQTLKRICTVLIENRESMQITGYFEKTMGYLEEFQIYLFKDLLFLGLHNGETTLMIHLRRSKIIRKIKNLHQTPAVEYLIGKECKKQLLHHFLITYLHFYTKTPIVEVYDFRRGWFTAQVQIPSHQAYNQITITDENLMIDYGHQKFGWKIKQQYL